MLAESIHGKWGRPIELFAGDVSLEGDLALPPGAYSLVIFAHGSEFGRHSGPNQFVAAELQRKGFGTLLLELLTEDEDSLPSKVFDIDFLATRLTNTIAQIRSDPETSGLRVGLFGASSGAAAALLAAAQMPRDIWAVVSRGGRPDLAKYYIARVKAPTLLLVGSEDQACMSLNEHAYALLKCQKNLSIVPRASHFFVEPGVLETVVQLSGDWFKQHLLPKPILMHEDNSLITRS